MEKMTLQFIFKLVQGMSLNYLIIDDEILQHDDLEKLRTPEDRNVIKGDITIEVLFIDTVAIHILGFGESFTVGSFNISYNGKNLFEKDETFRVKPNQRFNYNNNSVKVPLK